MTLQTHWTPAFPADCEVEGKKIHQVSLATFGKEADMVSLEQFRPIVLDEESSGHGLHIHHPFKVSPAISTDGSVSAGTRSVILLGKIEKPLVKKNPAKRERYRNFM